MRLIDADALVEVLRESVYSFGDVMGAWGSMIPDVCAMVREMPTAAVTGDAEYHRVYSRENYQRIKGIKCWECGAPVANGQTLCDACRDHRSMVRKLRRQADREAGRCTVCHHPMTSQEKEGGVRCPSCKAKFMMWEAKRHEREGL